MNEFREGTYTPQVSDRLRGGTELSPVSLPGYGVRVYLIVDHAWKIDHLWATL